jgi:hypothetical protein
VIGVPIINFWGFAIGIHPQWSQDRHSTVERIINGFVRNIGYIISLYTVPGDLDEYAFSLMKSFPLWYFHERP